MQRGGLLRGLRRPREPRRRDAPGRRQAAERAARRSPRTSATIYEHGMFVNAGFILGLRHRDGERRARGDRVHRGDGDPGEHGGPAGGPARHPAHPAARRGGPAAPRTSTSSPTASPTSARAGSTSTTRRPRGDILRDYLEIVETIYEPRAYFARVLRVGRQLDSSRRRFRPRPREQWRELRAFARLILRLRPGSGAFLPFWRALVGCLAPQSPVDPLRGVDDGALRALRPVLEVPGGPAAGRDRPRGGVGQVDQAPLGPDEVGAGVDVVPPAVADVDATRETRARETPHAVAERAVASPDLLSCSRARKRAASARKTPVSTASWRARPLPMSVILSRASSRTSVASSRSGASRARRSTASSSSSGSGETYCNRRTISPEYT